MNKNKLTFIIVILGAIGLVFSSLPQQEKIHYLEADLIIYHNFSELKEESDLVIVGTVKESKVWSLELDEPQFSPLLKTDFIVEIERVILGETKDLSITIVMTGGTIDDETTIIRGYPLLEIGEESIFFLKQTDTGRYIISGGPTGRYIIEEGKVYSLGEKNAEAKPYSPADLVTKGMPLEDFVSMIAHS